MCWTPASPDTEAGSDSSRSSMFEQLEPRVLLRALLDSAVNHALPQALTADQPPPTPRGQTIVIGA